MKKIYLIIFTFLLGINLSLANNFIKGDVYQNNFYDALGTGVTISFPPGEWKATKVSKKPNYTYINFKNIKKGAFMNLTLPNRQMGGYFRKGIDKCKSKKDKGNLYKVHSAGALRERLAVSYCIQSVDFENNDSYLNILLEAQRRQGTPLIHAFYVLWYPKKYSNVETLSKNQLKAIGESITEAFKNNINRNPGDYSAIKELLSFNDNLENSTSSSYTNSYTVSTDTNNVNELVDLSNAFVCRKSTSLDGMKWESIDSKFSNYVTEVFRRNLSLKECRKLTGRKPSEVNEKTKPADSIGSIKGKLEELKAMLDEGLISQELYDTKSTKLLEDF